MYLHPFKEEKKKELIEKTLKLYREGLTTREVGALVGRSHAWVALKVKKLSVPIPPFTEEQNMNLTKYSIKNPRAEAL